MMHETIRPGDQPPAVPSRYEPRGFDARILISVIVLQTLLAVFVFTYHIPRVQQLRQETLVVRSFELAAPPAPETEPPPVEEPPPPVALSMPTPVVQTPPTIQQPIAMPAQPVPVSMPTPVPAAAPAATPAAPAPPVAAHDLSASVIHAPSPRYPRESRRKREEGTVVLELLLAENGTVESIRVRQSSGYSRLDEEARRTVSRWRWSPTIQNGKAVRVRGLIDIPFVLIRT